MKTVHITNTDGIRTIKISRRKPSIEGHMIFIDGPDGSGKSTQSKHIVKYLEDRGYEVLHLRLPGMPGEHGDNVRKALFGKDRYRDFWAIRMMFAAEYLEFMDRHGYNKDKVVICDRNVITSNACIGGAELGSMREVIDSMSNVYNLADRKPDKIIIYNIEPQTSVERLSKRASNGGDTNYYDFKPHSFHSRSCTNYKELEYLDEICPEHLGLRGDQKTICSIDANCSEEEVTEKTIALLNSLYEIK